MRLLLIHQNFPAQFRDLVGVWRERGHELVALGEKPLRSPIEGLTYLAYGTALPPPAPFPAGPLDPDLEAALRRGWRVAEACRELRQQGYAPDAVIVHSSWGEALHLRPIWPQAVLLAYPELYGSPSCLGYGFDPELGAITPELSACIDRQNLLALAAIEAADAVVVPTQFQRSTFPEALQPRLHVIHEGVDTARVRPDAACTVAVDDRLVLRPGEPVVTFASRQLEPLRGLHSFMGALPALLRAHPTVQVLIAGGLEGPGYGAASCHPQGHGGAQLEALGERIDRSRVHWLGRLPYGDLLALFQVSAAHVYFTYPYTLSWSLLEAMACGAAVVASATGPVMEVIRHEHNGLLVPFDDCGALAAVLLALLQDPARRGRLGQAARLTVEQRYGLETSAQAYQSLIEQLAGG